MSKRKLFRLMVALLFASGVLGLVCTTATTAAPAAAPVLTPRVYLPLQYRHFDSAPPVETRLGVSERAGFLIGNSPQTLNLLTTAGLKIARTSLTWAVIEPQHTTPDHYNWAKSDEYLKNYINSGVEPFVLILTTPSWAGTSPCGPLYNNADFAEFFGAAVARYPWVKYWGLYNEVDGSVYSTLHGSSGGCFGEHDLDNDGIPDYEEYADLMRVSWKAMHNANPDAQLVFAILAFDNFTPETAPPGYPGGCCFNYNFFDELMGYMQAHPLPAGDKYADLLGFNDYLAYNLAYWDKHSTGIGVGAKANYLRNIMHAHGFDFPIVISEISGWPTLPSSEGVPQAMQARQAVQMYAQALYTDIKFTIWWTWDDYPETGCNFPVPCEVFKYGLVDVHLTPKISYYAVQQLVGQLQGWVPAKSRVNDRYIDLGFKKDGKRKRVVYAYTNTFVDASVKVKFKAHTLRVTDMMGTTVTTYSDNGTGKIKLTVNADPQYVEINP